MAIPPNTLLAACRSTSAAAAVAANSSDGTIAASGSSLADAALLSSSKNIVTGADGTKGVRLNTSPFIRQTVINTGSDLLLVYPNTSANDLGEGAGNPVYMEANSFLDFIV